jgi:catechol 2,3-dioxygenase-like lactoylglutathione lyase family enzyme
LECGGGSSPLFANTTSRPPAIHRHEMIVIISAHLLQSAPFSPAKGVPMISGTHLVLYSSNAEADRAFLRDTLGFHHVDAGHGWLIFALPPAEVAIHPADAPKHELYLMCDDLKSEIAALTSKGVNFTAVEEARWGSITKLKLPSGAEIGLYQPKHKTAL